MNAESVAALGAAGMCVGAGTAVLLTRTGAAVPRWAVIAGTGAAWAAASATVGVSGTTWLPALLVLTGLAVPLVAADLRHRRLPDILTLPAYPLVLATAPHPGAALLGAVVFGGAHLLVHLLRPRAMGAGDVKLAGALGAVLGGIGWLAYPAAAVLAALVTTGLAATRRWRDGVPHGPGLLVATTTLAALHVPP